MLSSITLHSVKSVEVKPRYYPASGGNKEFYLIDVMITSEDGTTIVQCFGNEEIPVEGLEIKKEAKNG
jgi:hypothetical protein